MVEELISLAKLNAASKALEFVNDAEVIGVGTGSTVEKFIQVLRDRKEHFKDRIFVASSIDTVLKLSEAGFRVVKTMSLKSIDVYVDGADEVDPELNMIKGGGAALTLEKILAYYSLRRVFIVDYRKLVKELGTNHFIPIEVLPKALGMIINKLRSLGYEVRLRYPLEGKYGPVISDVGGVIVDVLPEGGIKDPIKVDAELKSLPGVIETGLFIKLADRVIVGYADRAEVLKP